MSGLLILAGLIVLIFTAYGFFDPTREDNLKGLIVDAITGIVLVAMGFFSNL